jgi:hypothetical protein
VAHSGNTLAFERHCIGTRVVALLAAYQLRVLLKSSALLAQRIDVLGTCPYFRKGPLSLLRKNVDLGGFWQQSAVLLEVWLEEWF